MIELSEIIHDILVDFKKRKIDNFFFFLVKFA